jgi:hypothetical protein
MSEAYDYLKERVKELESDVKRKDEVLAWDADKILECTTRIVEQNSTIATLQVRIALLEKALTFIVNWKLPRVKTEDGDFSHGVAYGSNGERDYMRKVAKDALRNAEYGEGV